MTNQEVITKTLNRWDRCDYCNTKQYKGTTVRVIDSINSFTANSIFQFAQGELLQCLPCSKANKNIK